MSNEKEFGERLSEAHALIYDINTLVKTTLSLIRFRLGN